MKSAALRVSAAGVFAAMLAAAPAQAALVIDDFLGNNGVDVFFPTVVSNQVTGPQTGFHTSPGVVGGQRDVQARMTDANVYAGDNSFGQINVGAGSTNGFVVMGVGVDFGAEGDFLVQYDGVDAGMGLGPGLDLDIAAAGNNIQLSAIYNLFLVNNANAPTNLVIRLTDMSGQSAALTQTLGAGLVGFQTLNWGFGAFEAANNQLDLRHIKAIELSGTVRQELPLTGFLNLTGFGVQGVAYTPGNTIGGGSPTDPVAVPEPATWALLIAGFGLAGAALRRRRAFA